MSDFISTKHLRQFGLLVGFGFPLLIGWFIPFLIGHQFRAWSLIVGIPLLILAVVSPRLLYQPYRFWMALGHALGYVNSHLILGIIFILVLQPIAYIMRLTGYDPLRTRPRSCNSYRETRKANQINLTRIF